MQFDNNECTTPTNDYGTCLTSTECDDRGGSTQGNCASGFGVCCFFKYVNKSFSAITEM